MRMRMGMSMKMMVRMRMMVSMWMMEVMIMLMVMVVDNKYGDGWAVYSIINEGPLREVLLGNVDHDHK